MSQIDTPRVQPSHRALYTIIVLLLIVGGAAILYLNGAFRSRPKIAVVTSTEDSYWDLVQLGSTDAARDFGDDLTFVRSKPDAASQTKIVHDLLAGGLDGIGISPISPNEQTDLLNEAASKSHLVTFDSDAPNANRIAFIGSNNYEAGWQCAQEVRAAVPDGGQVILCVGTVDKLNGRDRRRAVIDNLLDRRYDSDAKDEPVDGEKKGDKYTVAATLIDNGDVDKAVSLAVEAIKSHPDLKCFVGLFGYNTPALLKALDQTGTTGKIKIIGFDEADELQAGIQNGTVFASILQDQYLCGYDTVRALNEAITGVNKSGPGGAQLRVWMCRVLTKDNIDQLRKEKRLREPEKK
jgi:ribose transport system substrate-binding protein